MSHELAKKLAEKHPRLFARTDLERSDVEPGWFNIIDRLCTEIENELANQDGADGFGIVQVKEKFGDLRIYTGGIDRESALAKRIYDLIKAASAECETSCQRCSKPAEQRLERGWCRTLCDSCESKAKGG